MTGPAGAPATDRPVAPWTGRLLFSPTDRLPNGAVRMEVHNAPAAHGLLLGKVVDLRFDPDDGAAMDFVSAATTEQVRFNDEARKSSRKGVIHPERLDGLDGVGPLESLAGGRPENDVHVSLVGRVKVVSGDGGSGNDELRICESPVQVKGRTKCLVTFVGGGTGTEGINGDPPTVKVVHYDAASGGFDGGVEEAMAYRDFGAAPAAGTRKGSHHLKRFSFRNIEDGQPNGDGWYVYGERRDGAFTIEAMEPRRCLRLRPDSVHLGLSAGMDYLRNKNWAGEVSRKGTVGSVLVDPDATSEEEAVSGWKVGDRAIVLHLYGGLRGRDVSGTHFDERDIFPRFLHLVPGHFSYGDATVVECPFTGEPVFDIVHRQVFCHGRLGVISGPNAWHSFCGDLYRGLLGNRALGDVLVKFPPATRTYALPGGGAEGGTTTFDPLGELIRELNEMGARYRTGGGTGSFLVSIESNCSQDSNQALFAALVEAEEEAEETHGALVEWLRENPENPAAKDLASLKGLGMDLDRFLTPFGVRRDWRKTAKGLSGSEGDGIGPLTMVFRALQTWRTMLPRKAHEGIASTFLERGAKLWFVRTTQVGGIDEEIKPLAPTLPFRGKDNEDVIEDKKCCAW